jgi:hypothetical protein
MTGIFHKSFSFSVKPGTLFWKHHKGSEFPSCKSLWRECDLQLSAKALYPSFLPMPLTLEGMAQGWLQGRSWEYASVWRQDIGGPGEQEGCLSLTCKRLGRWAGPVLAAGSSWTSAQASCCYSTPWWQLPHIPLMQQGHSDSQEQNQRR